MKLLSKRGKTRFGSQIDLVHRKFSVYENTFNQVQFCPYLRIDRRGWILFGSIIYKIYYRNFITCAMVATTKPKVNAICTIGVPLNMVDATPIATKKNVPRNSANSIFHMRRLFVMSFTPMIRLTPVKIKATKFKSKFDENNKKHLQAVSIYSKNL